MTDIMDAELKALEELSEKATPAPWIHNGIYAAILDGNVEMPMYGKIAEEPSGEAIQIDSDFDFITNVRNSFPSLLARLRRAEARSQWIKTSERLPEEGQVVLVYDDAVYMSTFDGDQFVEDLGFAFDSPVQYWMPLPEPPEHP